VSASVVLLARLDRGYALFTVETNAGRGVVEPGP
jgi:hypothetical protein